MSKELDKLRRDRAQATEQSERAMGLLIDEDGRTPEGAGNDLCRAMKCGEKAISLGYCAKHYLERRSRMWAENRKKEEEGFELRK